MAGSRRERLEKFIRDEVSSTLLFHLQDPRIGFLTVTGVKLSSDLRRAVVLLSILGDERDQAVSLSVIRRARGFVQKELAGKLATKFVPTISFEVDDSIKKSIRISKAIKDSQED